MVRTATVEYSLLAELPEAERHLYKGITKKRIRVPVQRLVLILPVEERDPDLLCRGQAGHYPEHRGTSGVTVQGLGISLCI